jgi:imidazoleglycerol phosphate dehydratase HisB
MRVLRSGTSTLNSGIGFLDHMLAALAKHGGWDLELTCTGVCLYVCLSVCVCVCDGVCVLMQV